MTLTYASVMLWLGQTFQMGHLSGSTPNILNPKIALNSLSLQKVVQSSLLRAKAPLFFEEMQRSLLCRTGCHPSRISPTSPSGH